MKLHEALRKLCAESGNIAVQKKNLVYLLSDLGAFEELPGMREVIKVMVSGGFARDLCARSLRNDREAFLQHAEEVKKALAAPHGRRSSGNAAGILPFQSRGALRETKCL